MLSSGNQTYWDRMKKFAFFSMVLPFVLLLSGIILEKQGFTGLVKNYDEGLARIFQYIIFGMGVLIFFFCEGLGDFFANRLFVRNDKTRLQENLSSYFAYTFLMLWMLNMISIFGFVGYLMCSNISWLTIFAILNFSLQTRYFPSEARFNKLIEFTGK